MEERQENEFKPIVTFIILGLNILVFFIEVALHGEDDTKIILKMGGAYTPYILENGQWYRLVTSMFLHFGINHIVSNSIALVAMGQYVEAYFGRIRYIIIYLLSGICGNLLSMYMDLKKGSFPVSVGASGAICGILGAMIIFAIDKRTRKTFPIPRIIFALIMVLLPGFGDSSIDAYAHLGGVISGFIISFLMYLIFFRRYEILDSYNP
ncbi:MAG: rhomboid family intramembrane serine protease [Eubacterium sp.]|nr:rhomboid family intramembrane serine protease [Eubacterium sp.]